MNLQANLKKILPKSLKSIIWQLSCEQLHLKFRLASGITVKLNSFSDWCMYNEIFADGEYDEAIEASLRQIGSDAFTVLDLGANTGFFTLRVIHIMRKLNLVPHHCKFLLIEGSTRMVGELKTRLSQIDNRLLEINIVHGLVGEKSGEAPFDIERSECANHIGAKGSRSPNVKYIDLSPLVADWSSVSLLKCDVEGAEGAFLCNYSDILNKTQTAVFEFHEEHMSPDKGLRMLAEHGLISSWQKSRNQSHTVACFQRNAQSMNTGTAPTCNT